jgi:signal transduction histidine kinase
VLQVDIEASYLPPIVLSTVLSVADPSAVTLDCPEDLWVLTDPIRLQQMLGNLVSNAFKYGCAPVEISARQVGEEVTITVTDHGNGVPTDFQARMFDQFSRAPGPRVKGLGLGLFLVRSLAEAQGGRVSYAPGPTGGAAFSITLPAAADPA